ncbi:protein ECERIFERUM 26-like [Durio zibethinus]|uniref:Protein ECERIFERUM 26-like n=1 Tax=Durio zibethinus TaxID=66656 RepID=A0A6P5XUZ6_DURZI|nr:protein ECERIFERUM 26-like [Durio zibethinus]
MAEGTFIFMVKRTVVSTGPVEPGKFCHLSVLDRLMEQNQVKIVYYYPSRADVEPGEWIEKLGDSFASAITNFPIITGRLQKNTEGHWIVKCNDGGVRMMEAKVKGSVEDWLKNVDREKELKLVYWEDMSPKPYYWSTFYLQVTEFENGGLAIGLSCTHLLADPICATMFFKAWADTTLSGIMSTPPFFYSLPLSKADNKNPNQGSYTDLIDYYKSSIERPTPLITNQKYATITLSFTDPMVRDCIAMAQATGASDKSRSLAFEALAALFWVCLSKIKGTNGRLLKMSLCSDMRNVLGLDQRFFGNCMVYNKVHLESAGENMLPEASKAIGEVMKKMNAEGIKDLIYWLQCNDNQTVPLMNGYDFMCANLEGVNPYLATFKDRIEPLRVSYYVEPVTGPGQVLIFRSAPGEGPLSRVAMATLPEDEAAKLCEDDLIQRFSPTVLMGTNKN